MTEIEERKLVNAFRTVGKEYGYDSVTAEFSEYKEFKIKWRRSCGWAEFEVSDYMADAPPEVMEGMAETIFSRITRKARKNYPKKMLDWISSEEFVKAKQPLYLMRSHNLTGTPVGQHADLRESYERLVKTGLVPRYENLAITWTKQPTARRVGFCSVLMKVIIISSELDRPEVPAFVLDYVLYHELIHLMHGFDPFGQRHNADFQSLEKLYPKHEEAEEWLKKMRLAL